MHCPSCRKEVAPDSYFCVWCSCFLPRAESGVKAGLFSRWVATAIDPFIAILLWGLAVTVLASISPDLGAFGAFAFPVVYGIWFLVLLREGQTPGKKLLGHRVVNCQTGQIPGYITMFVREIIGKFVSGLFFGLGYFWAIFDKNAQAWHDKMAGTVVVKQVGNHNFATTLIMLVAVPTVFGIGAILAQHFREATMTSAAPRSIEPHGISQTTYVNDTDALTTKRPADPTTRHQSDSATAIQRTTYRELAARRDSLSDATNANVGGPEHVGTPKGFPVTDAELRPANLPTQKSVATTSAGNSTLESQMAKLQAAQRERHAAHVQLLAAAGRLKSKFLGSLRRQKLDASELLAKFQTQVAKGDALYALNQEYRRWVNAEADLAAFRAKKADLDANMEELRTALERERTRNLAKAGLSDEERKQLDKLLADAEAEAGASGSAAGDKRAQDEAVKIVRVALTSHQSRLAARPALTNEQLPSLPELKYSTNTSSEKVMLAQLHKIVPDYQRRAAEQLESRQPEEALIVLLSGGQEAVRQLEAFPVDASWKSDALRELRASAQQLHDKIGEPYHEAAMAAALDDDWSSTIDFLEQLHDKAPEYSKLPDLLTMIRDHLRRKEKTEDPEAAAWLERFNEINRSHEAVAQTLDARRTEKTELETTVERLSEALQAKTTLESQLTEVKRDLNSKTREAERWQQRAESAEQEVTRMALKPPNRLSFGITGAKKCQDGIHLEVITAGSPATRCFDVQTGERLTMEPGDHILSVNGATPSTLEEFFKLVAASDPQMSFVVKDGRNGKVRRMTTTLAW